MSEPTPKELIANALNLYPPKIKANTTIVTPETLGQDYLLHVAKRKWDAMVPNVSRRGADSEDNTVPRLHMGTTLLNCIKGYASIQYQIMDNYVKQQAINKEKSNKINSGMVEYRGGYYLHVIPFEVALKPNKKLVYDVDYTDEHWLITYNTDTRFYRPKAICRLVTSSLLIEANMVNGHDYHITFLLDIPTDISVRLDDDKVLNKGYYKLVLFNQTGGKWNDKEYRFVKCQATNAGEFEKERQLKTYAFEHRERPV